MTWQAVRHKAWFYRLFGSQESQIFKLTESFYLLDLANSLLPPSPRGDTADAGLFQSSSVVLTDIYEQIDEIFEPAKRSV